MKKLDNILDRNPLKLNLGCYNKKIGNFVNIDVRPEVNPDLVDDVSKLEKIENGSVDYIYISHCLEHFTHWQALQALNRYKEVLKPGGLLRIAVPDIQAAMIYYQETGNLQDIKTMMIGSQLHEFDHHYNVWDFASLKKDLNMVGFIGVKRYDWRDTEHWYIDDYSQSYLPHMDKVNGRLMSLNVEARKL